MGEKPRGVITVTHAVLLEASRVPPVYLAGGDSPHPKGRQRSLGPPRVKGKVSASTGPTPRWLCKRRGHHPFPLMLCFFLPCGTGAEMPKTKAPPDIALCLSGSHKPTLFVSFCLL